MERFPVLPFDMGLSKDAITSYRKALNNGGFHGKAHEQNPEDILVALDKGEVLVWAEDSATDWTARILKPTEHVPKPDVFHKRLFVKSFKGEFFELF